MNEISWTVGGGGTSVPPSSKKKVPFAAKQRIKDEMTDSQKNGINQWNAMVDALKENGLMEDKRES